jgi:tripartite ATP-independent transporter DctM subunit
MTAVIIFVLFAIILMILSIPVAYAFAFAVVGMMLSFKLDHTFPIPTIFAQINSFILMAVPFFIFAGGLMGAGGISKRIVNFANSIVGYFRGGLGIVVIISAMFFGSISGSSAATVSSIGLIMLPQMEKFGYPRKYTTALVACAGLLGQLFPPSIPMILFGMLTGASVAGCFLATVSSGILLVLIYSIINYFQCRKFVLVNENEKISFRGFIGNVSSSARNAFFAILMPIIVLGGIYTGFFTPTEAGAIAAVYAFLVGVLIYRETTFKGFLHAAGETASIEGSVLFIMFFIFIMSKIFVFQRVPDMIAESILSISSNRIVILLLINLLLLILGMLVDDVSGILLATPLLYPLFLKLGVHPLQMAAIIAVNQGTGQLTPPVSTNLWVAARISNLNVADFFKYSLSFLIFGNLPVLLLITFMPELSLWLPKLILGKI